jgi:N-acylglucosamine 2-epimerase
MGDSKMQEFALLYRDELLKNVIPFWMKHSKDEQCGGYLTSLDRDGAVYDTDKWMWLQGRQVWMFAVLYQKVEQRPEWLEMAKHGAEFIRRFGADPSGAYYFGLTREGRPLVQPYNIFSDCFCAMGFGALSAIDGGYGELAKNIFDAILQRRDNPKGKYNKIVGGTRPLKSFALPMILCNLAMELESVMGKVYVDNLVSNLVDEIKTNYYKKEMGCILENVAPGGSFVDSFEGRTISPGHTIEAMWFLMDAGKRLGDDALIRWAADVALEALEKGWDKEFGGIYYFLDIKGKYPLQLEWDQKLWWVHLESLIACAKGYLYTGDNSFAQWFLKLHDYAWKHFKDAEHPEWFGYLNRRGETLFPFKGGKWKGCFHVPRAMLQLWKTLEQTR